MAQQAVALGCSSPQNPLVSFPHPPPAARAALAALCALDPDLARIEAAAGALPWRVRPPGFCGLLQAIVAQQISNQAAAAIWRRVAALPGSREPAGLLALSETALREAGLSRPKVAHARALATAFAEGRLATAALADLDDEAAVATIIAVRGLGRWTAEVYLLFALGRDDVFPAGDIALAAAAAHLKGLAERPAPVALRALADAWRPHRGLAARLLWHHWRHVTGRAALDDLAVEGVQG
ncbi:MAG: DNA-3-methyladenine glycosylase 2 family protein [Alphaproteobacteria bacterium]|nr:DNA-3-methyladenine glycosylase 2 family protein [Alphaproteobacteria bacterium]